MVHISGVDLNEYGAKVKTGKVPSTQLDRTVQKVCTVRFQVYIRMVCTVLHFRTYHKFKFLSRFCNNYGFCNILEFGNNQQFKQAKTHINYYRISQFFVIDKISFIEISSIFTKN